MKLSTIGRGLALGACASLALSGCVAGSNAGQSDSSATGDVTIGLTYIPNVQFAPVYVADAQGMYNDAGVTATVRHHGSDEGLLTALLAGQEDVVIASGDEAAVAASQGLDIVSIGQYYASYPGTVIVPADSPIVTLADLKGKTIGIPGEYGSSYYATLAAIKAGGLQTSDVTISSIGYTQQAALAPARWTRSSASRTTTRCRCACRVSIFARFRSMTVPPRWSRPRLLRRATGRKRIRARLVRSCRQRPAR